MISELLMSGTATLTTWSLREYIEKEFGTYHDLGGRSGAIAAFPG